MDELTIPHCVKTICCNLPPYSKKKNYDTLYYTVKHFFGVICVRFSTVFKSKFSQIVQKHDTKNKVKFEQTQQKISKIYF